MPFCPECRYEYRADINICPDCNVELVSTLPAKGSNSGMAAVPDDSWVGVARVIGDMSAEIARGALESSNIPAVVVSTSFGSFAGEGSSPILQSSGGGGSLLMVPREFREDALIIVRAILGDQYEETDYTERP